VSLLERIRRRLVSRNELQIVSYDSVHLMEAGGQWVCWGGSITVYL
jgi:hypothetical protein